MLHGGVSTVHSEAPHSQRGRVYGGHDGVSMKTLISQVLPARVGKQVTRQIRASSPRRGCQGNLRVKAHGQDVLNPLGVGKDSSQKLTHLCMREKSSRSHADRLLNYRMSGDEGTDEALAR